MTRVHRMPFGAEICEGKTHFRLWAPACAEIGLELDGGRPMPMKAAAEGWHELITDHASAGTRYRFVLPDGLRVPDPASRFQPEDVHGPSEVIDPAAWQWSDDAWKIRPWEETVLYELHIGAFTPEGTFRSAIGKLDHLVDLGVTAIEIMPVADFPGKRNWGYDGVLPYAPDSSYGRPDDLKALVEAAHARGLMVLLDVVYNHFGPDGNYLPVYAPQFFTRRHKTPWGPGINYDGPESRPVRDFVIHNAHYWIEEYHLDGLRLDAVHAIADDSPVHILRELAERVPHAHLVLENEKNQVRYLERDPSGAPHWYTAAWNDDVHHALHTAATGESHSYFRQFSGDTQKLGRALAEGFVRHESGAMLPSSVFIAFIQNHDQIGNRAIGDRLSSVAPAAAVRAVAAVYLLLPEVPMLFMGEEWNAAQPFPFFCDFGPDLAEAVRKGRREEFPEHSGKIPDPQDGRTFASAKLHWEDVNRHAHAGWLAWYRRILGVRRQHIVPGMRAGRFEVIADGAVVVCWEALTLAANLSAVPVEGFPQAGATIFWQEGEAAPDGRFGPWTVRWSR